jgi:hypothetical protein
MLIFKVVGLLNISSSAQDISDKMIAVQRFGVSAKPLQFLSVLPLLRNVA